MRSCITVFIGISFLKDFSTTRFEHQPLTIPTQRYNRYTVRVI